jgi:hypothetical protein
MADGQVIAQLDAQFGADEATITQVPPGENMTFPLAIPLKAVAISQYGMHSVEILVDNQHVDSLPFVVAEPQTPADDAAG